MLPARVYKVNHRVTVEVTKKPFSVITCHHFRRVACGRNALQVNSPTLSPFAHCAFQSTYYSLFTPLWVRPQNKRVQSLLNAVKAKYREYTFVSTLAYPTLIPFIPNSSLTRRGLVGTAHPTLLRCVSERVDTDNPISLAPRVTPPVYPFTNPCSQACPRSTTSNVLCASVFFLANNRVGYIFPISSVSGCINIMRKTQPTQSIIVLLLQLRYKMSMTRTDPRQMHTYRKKKLF